MTGYMRFKGLTKEFYMLSTAPCITVFVRGAPESMNAVIVTADNLPSLLRNLFSREWTTQLVHAACMCGRQEESSEGFLLTV